jgi:hypothetical protein
MNDPVAAQLVRCDLLAVKWNRKSASPHETSQRFSGAYSFDPRMDLSVRQKTRLSLSIAGLWVGKRTERRQNSWATVKTVASRVFALKGHNMSARGKRSGAAAERRPGLPIDGIPIALKGRNRRRTLVPGFPSVSFIGLSWCCSVPRSSTVRDIPWHIARFHVALLPSPTLMISSDHARPSGLAFVAPFQGFVTRIDSQPRATQPLVELADACPGLTCSGPFRAIEFVCQTRSTPVRAMEMPCRGRVKSNRAVISTL